MKRINSKKKAISPVVATALLLVVAVVAVVNFQSWFDTFQSVTQTKVEQDSVGGVVDLNYVDSQKLYVKNPTNSTIKFNNIKIGNKSCDISGNVTGEGLLKIDLGFCTTGMTKGYKSVTLFTNKGIFSETLKLNQDGIVGNLTLSCTGTEILSYDTTNHAEIASNNAFANPICIDHNAITITNPTTCSNSQRLFYLGATNNSHIYITNTTAYDPGTPNYYNWQEICVGSSGMTIDLKHQLADPNDGSLCVAGYIQDDVYGGIVGSCSLGSATGKIWLNLI